MDYKQIYERVFREELKYNDLGEQEENYLYVTRFLNSRVDQFNSVVDFGSGRGVLLNYLLEIFQPNQILSCDLARFHDLPIEFMELDLTKDLHLLVGKRFFDLVTCTDVLEHLEPCELDQVLNKLSNLAKYFVFTIANHCSPIGGVELHLTREPFPFWKNLLEQYFIIEEFQVMKKEHLFGFVLTSKICRRSLVDC